jgi:hypothetical protein
MIPTYEGLHAEHRLRIARADRLGPHLAELERRRRRRGRRLAVRAPIGRTLVAAGTWLHATLSSPRITPAR